MGDTTGRGVESFTQKKLAEERETRTAGREQSGTKRWKGGEIVGRESKTDLAAVRTKTKD